MGRGIELVEKVAGGRKVAVVTDAGTPGISDPGKLLIEAALGRGIEPVIIPGVTALISALVVSGLPPHPFVFLGFPPARGSERRRFFAENVALPMTLILYESPKRLLKTFGDILEGWGDRHIVVARELTKIHEEFFRGLVSEAMVHFESEVRGEVTLVVAGAGKESRRESEPTDWEDELRVLLEQGVSSKEAASAISGRFDLSRRLVYQAALRMRK
jgi:16S rRNA (cytidine1402-2'-O)-methyltransferase